MSVTEIFYIPHITSPNKKSNQEISPTLLDNFDWKNRWFIIDIKNLQLFNAHVRDSKEWGFIVAWSSENTKTGLTAVRRYWKPRRKQKLENLNCWLEFIIFEKWGEREEIAEADQGTSVCTLLIEQIEFANVILLNKVDLVSKEELERVNAVVKKLNPAAKILHTKYSKVDPKEVLNTGLFNFMEAQFHAGWLKEIRGEHVPENLEYGISSFVMRSRTPMSSKRWEEFLASGIMKEEHVIRAKGNLWLDCCDSMITVFDVAGPSIEINAESEWFIEMKNNEPEAWEEMAADFKEAVIKDFHGDQGDRRQEMVFIGKDMNEQRIRAAVEACLLTEEELSKGKEIWSNVPNPFEFPEQDNEMSLTLQDAGAEEVVSST